MAGTGALAFALMSAVMVWLLLTDCFSYRRKPIRFNRRTRTVHAFRHNGPGGVIAVPWDRAFFYLERQSTNAAIGTTPCHARCHVLDEQGIVRHSFGFGTREVILGGESSPLGQGALERVRANFEFVRRYMEEGPAALPPVAEYLPVDVSFRHSLRLWFDRAKGLSRLPPALQLLTIAMTAPLFLMAVFHYLAQSTSREPAWPQDMEIACRGKEVDAAQAGSP